MEREGITLFENNKGFFGYILKDEKLLITDLFIDPEHRGKETSKYFVDMIEKIAKENNLDKVFCTVCKDALNYEQAKQFVEKNGYKKYKEVNSLLYYWKILED
jgi:GNAT superfamily N-acetyltransferase